MAILSPLVCMYPSFLFSSLLYDYILFSTLLCSSLLLYFLLLCYYLIFSYLWYDSIVFADPYLYYIRIYLLILLIFYDILLYSCSSLLTLSSYMRFFFSYMIWSYLLFSSLLLLLCDSILFSDVFSSLLCVLFRFSSLRLSSLTPSFNWYFIVFSSSPLLYYLQLCYMILYVLIFSALLLCICSYMLDFLFYYMYMLLYSPPVSSLRFSSPIIHYIILYPLLFSAFSSIWFFSILWLSLICSYMLFHPFSCFVSSLLSYLTIYHIIW